MEIFKRLVKSIDENKDDSSRAFGEYYIERKVTKHSQQGLIVIAKNKIEKEFAIKFYRPSDQDPEILKLGKQRFIHEVEILVTLHHRNIVNVNIGGRALWNMDDSGQWIIEHGFANVDLQSSDEVLYYVMDYIEGEDISSLFPCLRKTGDNNKYPKVLSNKDIVYLFEEMISQVASAMIYYQEKQITHRDIKPDNIRFSRIDSTFIVVDFGFARHFDSTNVDEAVIIRTEIMDPATLLTKDPSKNDLGQFAIILLKILDFLREEYDSNRYIGMIDAISKARSMDLNKRYKFIEDFYNTVKQFFISSPEWKLQLQLTETLCSDGFGKLNRKLRIPFSGSILLSDEVIKLVDTAEFQRLRGIRQLGPTIFVFPGANHTRYEHSLGVYHLALKYLEKLSGWAGFRKICHPLDETIKNILLSALLHDIGHYPYSHCIEDIDSFHDGTKLATHEKRARRIILESEIESIIKSEWNLDPEIVANIIAYEGIKTPGQILINKLINSPLDMDKIDYLIRDSIHCGVDYGKGIDLERFLDSLCVEPKTNTLCLTDKGMSCLLSIIACRNIMYQEIYWHKSVQAADAMFKRFIYEYFKRQCDEVSNFEEYIKLPDDHFTVKLIEGCKQAGYDDLVKLGAPLSFGKRRLYKPAFIYYLKNYSKELADVNNFFGKVLETKSYKNLVAISEVLSTLLKDKIPGISELDILIGQTPIRKRYETFEMGSLQIWNLRREYLEDYPTQLNQLNEYLEYNRRAYIFCNPEYYGKISKLSSDKDQFADLLKDCSQKCQF